MPRVYHASAMSNKGSLFGRRPPFQVRARPFRKGRRLRLAVRKGNASRTYQRPPEKPAFVRVQRGRLQTPFSDTQNGLGRKDCSLVRPYTLTKLYNVIL